jgi:MFS family permease
VGEALMFPFLTLYVTQKFGVGMTEVGVIFAIFSVSSLAGSFLGGALTDKLGRRALLLFGLVFSSLSALAMGLVTKIGAFYGLAAIVGLLASTGGPAQQAMVADLLPPHQRAQGYGLLRVAANLAIAIGPMIGGLLATYSFLWLFIGDAIGSLLTAILVYAIIPETKPKLASGEAEPSLAGSIGGYNKVLRDRFFMTFILMAILMTTVYVQMNSTLAVYLRDVHGVTTQQFGYIISLNAGMVVLFQFWITRRIANRPPLLMMVAGTILYAVGFALYGFVSAYAMFLAAMAIITVGEMLVSPTSQAVAARLAPEDMRGRYMAIFGISWAISGALGPLAAGFILDNFNPDWLWAACGILATIAALGFLWMHIRAGKQLESIVPSPHGEVTVQTAAEN